jgi:hypothetical protein
MATSLPQRVPENSAGDFYVERDVCTRCCIPHGEATDLLNDPSAEFRECYFRRQPKNEAEVEQACRAVWVSCVGGPRYGGDDPTILARLRELGVAHQCDQLPGSDESVPPAMLSPKRSWWRWLFGRAG